MNNTNINTNLQATMKSAKQEMFDEKMAFNAMPVIYSRLLAERLINARQFMVIFCLFNFSRNTTVTNIRRLVGFDSETLNKDLDFLLSIDLIQKADTGIKSVGTLYRIETAKKAFKYYHQKLDEKREAELAEAKKKILAKE
jgi:predicted transcriptional regulator